MYTPLYIKSNYSFLTSLVKIDNLIDYAFKNNIKSLALCDDNMIGIMYFYKKCLEKNIKAIIGYDLLLGEDHILIYAMGEVGYKNLCYLSSFDCDINELNKHLDDVVVIVPFLYKYLYDKINSSNKYIGISSLEEEQSSNTDNTVFINKILYINKNDSKYYKYLLMMKNKLNVFDDIKYTDNNNYLLSVEEIKKLCSSKCIQNTLNISNMCNFSFEKKDVLIPKYKNNHNIDSFEYLSNLSIKGLEIRLKGVIPDTYKNRLSYELNVINKMGFSDYFLIVYDYVKYAKMNKILVGPGRGSAASSLVAYSLGIIDIDPIKYNLIFERFLNPGRITMPDIDIDFPDIYRGKVINYVKDKYGLYNVAGIVAVSTLKSKAVLDEVSRILKIDSTKTSFLKRFVSSDTNLKDLYNNLEFKNIVNNDERLKLLYELSCFFEGFPKNTTVHASGIVISSSNLYDVMPLIKDDDKYLCSYEMGYLEELGLLKMDFLGNKNLTIIMDILSLIEKYEDIKIDLLDIPLDDKDTIKLFESANTNGIFQFESNAMKSLLKRLKPSTFDEIVASDALVRPGPDTDTYINRKNNGQRITYLNSSLEEVLKDTYGVLVFQEQIIKIANVMAGFSLSEADNLRRAMGKKKKEILEGAYKDFINGSIKNGYKKEDAEKMYDDILKFSSYGFNKAHTVSYSILAYQMAYLKSHYPKYFYTVLISYSKGSSENLLLFINEAKKSGIKFYLPDINKSSEKLEIEEDGIRLSFAYIKGLNSNISLEICNSRGKGFKDIYDAFVKIIGLNISINLMENLIYASCFDSFGYNKNTLISNLDNLYNYAYISKGLDEDIIEKPEIDIKEEFNRNYLLEKEKEVFGMYLNHHPTSIYKEEYKAVDLSNIKNYLGRYVNVVIIIDRFKSIKDKNGNDMAFITGSDDSGDIEITFFSDSYDSIRDVKKGDILLVQGKVILRGDIKLTAQKAKIII